MNFRMKALIITTWTHDPISLFSICIDSFWMSSNIVTGNRLTFLLASKWEESHSIVLSWLWFQISFSDLLCFYQLKINYNYYKRSSLLCAIDCAKDPAWPRKVWFISPFPLYLLFSWNWIAFDYIDQINILLMISSNT